MGQLVVINRDFLFACLRGLFVPPRLEVRDVVYRCREGACGPEEMGRPNPRQQCLQMPDEGTGIDAS